MSNWKCWPDRPLSKSFANIERPDQIIYPDLRDTSDFVIACDHSGEHSRPEFRVVSFLLTTYKAIDEWEPLRLEIRRKHLPDGRRMSFKALNDARRINALPSVLRAASQLNGVLVCVGVEKGFSFNADLLLAWQHSWTADTLNKLLEICIFGAVMVDGLRGSGQNVHWITDDDSTVSNQQAKTDALTLMRGLLHDYPGEHFNVALGIASQFDDDRRAEDLVAIPDLAAGAFSETLSTIGKSNLHTSGVGPQDTSEFVQIKTTLINAWRYDNSMRLKHLNAIVRPRENGQMLISFISPYSRILHQGESADGAPSVNAKWHRALEADLKDRGIDPDEVIKSMGPDEQ